MSGKSASNSNTKIRKFCFTGGVYVLRYRIGPPVLSNRLSKKIFLNHFRIFFFINYKLIFKKFLAFEAFAVDELGPPGLEDLHCMQNFEKSTL